MATDATGTPTPLGIPKYNVNVDKPTGAGFNATMDSIDTIITAKGLPTAGGANQVPVWNGTNWVAQAVTAAQITDGTVGAAELAASAVETAKIAAAAVDSSKLATGAAVANLADGTVHGRKVIWNEAATPPGSPTEGDIWVMHPISGTTWMFRYDPTEDGTYPWSFVGGGAVYNRVDAEESTTSSTYANLTTVGPTINIPRVGVYNFDYGCAAYNNATVFVFWASFESQSFSAADADGLYLMSADTGVWPASRRVQKTVTVAGNANMKYRVGGGTGFYVYRFMSVTPVRIA